jgi:hypothetical protein
MSDIEQCNVSSPEPIRRKSVKELSAVYSGTSTGETQTNFERRMRVYEKVWSLTRYASDKKAILKLNSPMKRKLMENWSSAVMEEEKHTEISAENARIFLADHGVVPDVVGNEQWSEWEEAITIATSPVRDENNVNALHFEVEPCRLELEENKTKPIYPSDPHSNNVSMKRQSSHWYFLCICPCKQ